MDYIESIKLAELWLALEETRKQISNKILPLAAYWRADDDGELPQTLELAQSAIHQYLTRRKLQACEIRENAT